MVNNANKPKHYVLFWRIWQNFAPFEGHIQNILVVKT